MSFVSKEDLSTFVRAGEWYLCDTKTYNSTLARQVRVLDCGPVKVIDSARERYSTIPRCYLHHELRFYGPPINGPRETLPQT